MLSEGINIERETIRKNIETTIKQPIIQELYSLFKQGNKELYLVGGSVRDALLGKIHEDFDFATEATPDEIVNMTKKWADNLWLVGARFGTVNLNKNGFKIEITTFRQEIYQKGTRHPEVSFSKEIESDLSRRDFTINAMAIKLPEGESIDPFGGERW